MTRVKRRLYLPLPVILWPFNAKTQLFGPGERRQLDKKRIARQRQRLKQKKAEHCVDRPSTLYARINRVLRSVFVPRWRKKGQQEARAEKEQANITADLEMYQIQNARLRELHQCREFRHITKAVNEKQLQKQAVDSPSIFYTPPLFDDDPSALQMRQLLRFNRFLNQLHWERHARQPMQKKPHSTPSRPGRRPVTRAFATTIQRPCKRTRIETDLFDADQERHYKRIRDSFLFPFQYTRQDDTPIKTDVIAHVRQERIESRQRLESLGEEILKLIDPLWNRKCIRLKPASESPPSLIIRIRIDDRSASIASPQQLTISSPHLPTPLVLRKRTRRQRY